VALAPDRGEIEIWGDGEQTRSFMNIDDCVDGVLRLVSSDNRGPLNLGTSRLITINGLVDLVCEIAGKKLVKRHDLSGPQGVRGRNSDNTRVYASLGWEPKVSLEDGMATTYRWIESQLIAESRIPTAASC
jgi:nucleoside-diphosphate-sugar epimerase